MEIDTEDSAAIRIPPPLYFFLCLGCGLVLEYFFPINAIRLSLIPRMIAGVVVMTISGYFASSAFFVLRRNKTPFGPSQSTVRIVKTGAFRYSRNPLYFSLLLLLFGIAVLMFSLWIFLTIPILYLLLLFKAVLPEESYLSKKFGNEYLTYSTEVRRWI